MRDRDLEDAAGIAQALQQQRLPVAQAAPGIAQAAGGQMGGGMNPDFVNYLQSIAQGAAPDFQKMYETKQAMMNVPERGAEEFNLKNLFKFVADATAKAAEANAANPRGGLGSAFAAGSRGAYEKRENKHNQKYAGNKDILADLQKSAEDHRKYNLEKQKLEAASTRDKFNPVTGELIRFENGKAVGGVGGGMAAPGTPRMGQGNVGFNQVVPNPTNSGFGTTPKGQMKAYEESLTEQKEINKETRKKLSDISTQADEMSSQLGTINTLESLMKDFSSGPIAGGIYHEHVGSFLGDKNTVAAKTFQKLATQAFTLATSQSMKGAQSDKDMGLITGSQIGIDSDERTNQNLLNAYKAQAQRYNQYANNAKIWTDQGGDLEEFKRRWRRYANANPLLERSDDGEISINGDSLGNAEMVFDPNFDNMIGAYEPITQTNKQAEKNTKAEPETSSKNPYDQMSLEEKERLLHQLEGK